MKFDGTSSGGAIEPREQRSIGICFLLVGELLCRCRRRWKCHDLQRHVVEPSDVNQQRLPRIGFVRFLVLLRRGGLRASWTIQCLGESSVGLQRSNVECADRH